MSAGKLSRRAMLAGSAVAVTAGAIVATVDATADGVLNALADEWIRLEWSRGPAGETEEEADARLDAVCERQGAIVKEATALQARTMPDVFGKVRLLRALIPCHYTDKRDLDLLDSIERDLRTIGGAA
jgi:hypothetical protein